MKRSYLKRSSKPMRPKAPINLKRKAWEIFSKWIRQRDGRCVTCGSTNRLCGGHFWHGVLDFDEMNINCQCDQCNRHLSGNLAKYSAYLINKYGVEKFKDLEKRHWIALKGEYMTDGQYLEIISKYKLSTLQTNDTPRGK